MYDLLCIFQKATEAQSGSTYLTLSMTERIYEMLVDAVNDFKEVRTGVLSDIAFIMEEKLLS